MAKSKVIKLRDGRIKISSDPGLDIAAEQNQILKELVETMRQSTALDAKQLTVPIIAAKSGKAVNQISESKLVQTIDFDGLKAYFDKKFLGIGENSYNYFNFLENDLPTITSKKEIGMVARKIFESYYFKNKTMKFADWLRVFFNIMRKSPPSNQSKSRYEPNDKISTLFRYL